jgi:hypothetical protein
MPLGARFALKLAEVAVTVLLAGPGERGEGGQSTAHHIVRETGGSCVCGRHCSDPRVQKLPIRAAGFLAVALVLAALLSERGELGLKDGGEFVSPEATRRAWGAPVGRGG